MYHQLIETFESIVTQKNPIAVMSFIRGGITDNRDHKTVNKLVAGEFNENSIYFALSGTRADILSRSVARFGLGYRVAVPVDDNSSCFSVDNCSSNQLTAALLPSLMPEKRRIFNSSIWRLWLNSGGSFASFSS